MSGVRGALGDLASLATATSAPVVLGGFVLQGPEVPSRIVVGGKQVLTLHKLPGGGRVIDAMGPDDDALAWHGVFAGPYAAQRARTLDVMRQQGAPVILSFGDYTFTIIISHYIYSYAERGTVVTYDIKGELVSQGTASAVGEPDLSVELLNDMSAGIDVMKSTATTAVSYATVTNSARADSIVLAANALNSLATALATNASTTLSTSNLSLQAKIQTAGTAVQEAIISLAPSGVGPLGGDLSSCSGSDLAFVTSQAAVLAALVRTGAYLNRAGSNLAQTTGRSATPLVHA